MQNEHDNPFLLESDHKLTKDIPLPSPSSYVVSFESTFEKKHIVIKTFHCIKEISWNDWRLWSLTQHPKFSFVNFGMNLVCQFFLTKVDISTNYI